MFQPPQANTRPDRFSRAWFFNVSINLIKTSYYVIIIKFEPFDFMRNPENLFKKSSCCFAQKNPVKGLKMLIKRCKSKTDTTPKYFS